MPSTKKNLNPHAKPRVYAGPENSQVRAYRMLRGWRQQDLAVRSGLTQIQVSFFERGFRTPTPEQRRRIALALEVAVEEIFPLEDPAAAPAKAEDSDEAGRS